MPCGTVLSPCVSVLPYHCGSTPADPQPPLRRHAASPNTKLVGFRTQNWIGGSDYNPCTASFVPPPPESVPERMEDLVAFCNDDSLPAVAQAAVAHAQFETIHPFIDGNGRTGRTLIHLVLRRRGVATRFHPPVSLILATHAKNYVEGLTATRYRGPATATQAQRAINTWVRLFAGACTRAVNDAERFEQRAQSIEREWRDRLGRVRANSASDLLLHQLVGAPVINVKSACRADCSQHGSDE